LVTTHVAAYPSDILVDTRQEGGRGATETAIKHVSASENNVALYQRLPNCSSLLLPKMFHEIHASFTLTN
jgi:hypothetical protein